MEERDNTVSIESNYASKLGRLVKVPRRASVTAGQGKIFTDFEFKLVPLENQTKPERSGKKFLVQLEQEVCARIEGGGPEMHFKIWNGDIFIRKRGR